MRRWIMHVDMDAFFASVEQRDDPALQGKPVIVGGKSRRSVVATASYEARAFGVHSAMPLSQAKRLYPHGCFAAPRFEAYREASDTGFPCRRCRGRLRLGRSARRRPHSGA